LDARFRRLNVDLSQIQDVAKALMDRCYALFPIETVQFRGETFTRGMMVRVRTISCTFEGRLLGSNDRDVVGVLTRRKIAADLLENIEEIVKVE
jgi:hypothetical protein